MKKNLNGKSPTGMAAKIGALAARPQGASRAELTRLTKWEQQAWKWYFHNSKGNGFCQRHGFKLEVIERDSGEIAYRIAKK